MNQPRLSRSESGMRSRCSWWFVSRRTVQEGAETDRENWGSEVVAASTRWQQSGADLSLDEDAH